MISRTERETDVRLLLNRSDIVTHGKSSEKVSTSLMLLPSPYVTLSSLQVVVATRAVGEKSAIFMNKLPQVFS